MSAAPDYLERFPEAHRASADQAYQDGFTDGHASAEVERGSLLDQFKALLAEGLTVSSVFQAMGEHQAATEPELAPYLAAAEELHFVQDGECEIDTQGGGLVSIGGDGGAYVLAWVWVTDEEAGLAEPDDSEEYPLKEEGEG